MKLIPMTKKEAKKAEEETTPISNLVYGPVAEKPSLKNQPKYKNLQEAISKMYDWKYTKHHYVKKGLGTTKQNKKHFISRLGEPIYHVNYEARNAVWGFKVNNVRVLCYYSTLGFSVQIDEDCDAMLAARILRKICLKLEK